MISCLKKALELYEATNNKKGMISSCNNLASEFFSISNFERAIFFNKKGIDISKKFSNLKSLAEFQSNIANVYVSQGNKEKAKYYYEEALMFKDYEYRPYILKRFAEFNETEKNYEKALDLYKSAIKILEKNKEASASYSHYLGIGRVLSKMKDNKLALEYLNKALEKVKEEQVPIREAEVYISFFEHYNRVNNDFQTSKYINKYLGIVRGKNYLTPFVQGKFANGLFKVAVIEEARLNNKKALECYLESKKFSEQALNIQYELETSQNLYNLYKKMGNYQKALQIHESYINLKDTLAKIDGIQEDLNNELLQNFELENQADSIKHAEEIILHQANAKTQKQRSNGLVLISIIILVSLGLVFSQLKKVKKGKLLVEERNVVIEEKQKEITDSINYAKRLQDGILVPLDLVKSWLSESFILFKPKDIVSGDFYWIEKVGDKIYFAVADCTGHGIPGALVSIICSNALSKSLQEDKITSPAKILDATRQLVEQRFVRATDSIKDGMDISLCCLNVKSKTITWAGAMNPLWVVQKEAKEIQEIKPDRQAIGRIENPKLFTEHKLKLAVGDSVYLFSDGYPDQFGGPKGKKYMKGKMKKYVLSVQNESMQEQLASFEKEFNSWKGSIEQIDDVCVMGVRIT
jgi:serine phosphatase RsbU (regulator of sigma subunit)